ncbi:MAG: CotH kinase family protein [Bacteroidales bacterium]
MKFFAHIITLLFLVVTTSSCHKEEVIYNPVFEKSLQTAPLLTLNNAPCGFDAELSLLRASIQADTIHDFTPFISFQNYSQIYFNDSLELKNNDFNNLGTITTSESYTITITTNSTTKKLTLQFTNLPIAIISTPNKIYDEPKTVAHLSLYLPQNDECFTSDIGIEYRGATSLFYPKKSFGFALTHSINTSDRYSSEIGTMRKNEDWIFDAMYIDKSRVRNMVSFKLWNELDSLKRGIQSQLVEVFINHSHQGVYCFNEKLNPEFLGLTQKGALLYKGVSWLNGGTKFETNNPYPESSYRWDGWEQVYPDPEYTTQWEPLDTLKNIAVNYSDEDFITHIGSYINIDNVIDYYIFLNLISAWDNAGKNIFLTRSHSAEKFSFLPWDLDGTWGYFWDGKHITHTNIINTNQLFNKLIKLNPDNYKTKLKTRWFELRNSILTYEHIHDVFEKEFETVLSSNCIKIENKKWDLDVNIKEERAFTYSWIKRRLRFLDQYYSNL